MLDQTDNATAACGGLTPKVTGASASREPDANSVARQSAPRLPAAAGEGGYPGQRANRNCRKPLGISYMKISTRNSLQHSQSPSLTSRTRAFGSWSAHFDRYTCRTKSAVSPCPSTKRPKLIDTLSSIPRMLVPSEATRSRGIRRSPKGGRYRLVITTIRAVVSKDGNGRGDSAGEKRRLSLRL